MTAPTPSPSAALPGAFQAHSLDQVKAALALAHGGTAAAADDAAEAPESDTFRHFSRISGRLPAVPGRVACGDCAPSRGRLAAGRAAPEPSGLLQRGGLRGACWTLPNCVKIGLDGCRWRTRDKLRLSSEHSDSIRRSGCCTGDRNAFRCPRR